MKQKQLDIALKFAALGAKIVPEDKGKKPKIKGWLNGEASSDPEKIKGWAEKWPDCNFSTLTGAASGFFALDIDIKNGSHGMESWEKMKVDAGVETVKTFLVQTGSGGFHPYFLLPPGFAVPLISQWPDYPGVEVKGDGGKVTLAGSYYADGREYRVVDDNGGKFAECPDWLLKLIKAHKKKRAPKPIADQIETGNRDISLFKIGCSWRGTGMEYPEILTGLLQLNKTLPEPLPEDQVQAKAESASKYRKGHTKKKEETTEEDSFEFSDMANGERFFRKYGKYVHYCTISRSWFCWTGKKWQEDDNQIVSKWAKRTMKEVYVKAWDLADEKIAAKARACKSRLKIESMLALAMSEGNIPIRPNELDTDPWFWNCDNGTMDLRSVGLLQPHDPDQLISKIAPVEFNDGAKCPLWDAFLLQIMSGDPEMVSFLQRMIGYCLTGDMRERKYFTLHGNGNNGKSVFLEVLMEIFGDYAATALPDTFLRQKAESIQHDTARLRGSRMVCISETDKKARLDETLIKTWTGADTLSGRFLYAKRAFDFRPVGKLVIRTNYPPKIDGVDEGIWSRSLFVEFAERFEGERDDKELKDKLLEELPGIFRWCLVGCAQWQSHGLNPPEKVLSAGKMQREEMDELGDFFSEYLVIGKDARITSARLYEIYGNWCDSAGVKYRYTQAVLGREMSNRGFKSARESKVRYRMGLGEK